MCVYVSYPFGFHSINNLMIADYAAIQKSVKDDVVMIEKRKRMLQSFLNRVLNHSKLGSEHVFHRFLESGVSWVRKEENV